MLLCNSVSMQRWETCGANFENGGVVWLDGKRLSQVAAQAERQAVTREMPQKLKIWQCLLTGVAC